MSERRTLKNLFDCAQVNIQSRHDLRQYSYGTYTSCNEINCTQNDGNSHTDLILFKKRISK